MTIFLSRSFCCAFILVAAASGAMANDVAGVVPSLAKVVRDFQSSDFAQTPVCMKDTLAEVLQKATEGKTGPFLLVTDGTKVRIMELKPEAMQGTNP